MFFIHIFIIARILSTFGSPQENTTNVVNISNITANSGNDTINYIGCGNISSRNGRNKSTLKKNKTDIEGKQPTLREKIHDKVAFLAAKIDGFHYDYQTKLSRLNLSLTAAEINQELVTKIVDILVEVRPYLIELAVMSKDAKRSARKLSYHFNVDHMRTHVVAMMKGQKPPRGLADSLAERLHKFAEEIITDLLTYYKYNAVPAGLKNSSDFKKKFN